MGGGGSIGRVVVTHKYNGSQENDVITTIRLNSYALVAA